MKKNKAQSQSNASRGELRREADRNKALLILAILFFLLSLWILARANGFSLRDALGLDGGGSGSSLFGTQSGRGGSGGVGGPGAPGRGGTNGSNGGNGSGNGTSMEELNVNVQTDSGLNVDAGIDEQGQLYVDPQANPNPQGGTGAEASVNDSKVIDTGTLFGQ